jgi:hypothetical protein
LNKNNNDFFTIIEEGPYKGMRLYYGDKCGGEHTLPIEMYCLFQNAFKYNYRVFYLSCVKNHNIIIPENDLDFLKTSINIDEEEKYKQHVFSENVLNIKDLQYKDLLKLYDISINSNKINAIFTLPYLDNEFYCFNIYLIIENDFDLNQLLELDFNLVKINSIIEYFETTLSIELMQKTFDLLNLQFKDYLIPFDEIQKTEPYDLFKLPEKIKLDDLYDIIFDFEEKHPNSDSSHLREQLDILKKQLSNKEDEL